MAVKVSVVVPVYNPGRHIDGLLASLRRQSLPPDEFETIFVDDGSTDGTRERLEALAAETANFRVIAIPRSGWPGRPRNVGIDAARGEYIQFVDDDDELGDEALERLWNYAKANDSDIVIGREERRHRRMPVGRMFSKNRPRAVFGEDPLLGLLTPHKMFRRDFLIERDIRFLEGPRRLEDHHFVVKAYFRAKVISVLADYPCYFWIARLDDSQASRGPYEWFSYYGFVRDVLDVVEEHTEPGPFRDRLLAHWYRGKGLRKLGESMAAPDEENARRHFQALRRLTEERFPPGVDDHLGRMERVRSALLRAGDFERYRSLAMALHDIHLNEQVEYVRTADGALEMLVRATLAYGDGAPVMVEDRDGHEIWRPPVPLGDAVPEAALDFTGYTPNVHVVARRFSTHETLRFAGRTERLPRSNCGATPLGAMRRARLRPATADRGRPMRLGSWALHVQLSGGGWRAKGLLKSTPAGFEPARAALVVPFATPRGQAELVAIPPGADGWSLRARPARGRSARLVERMVRRTLMRVPRARAAARRLRGAAHRLRRSSERLRPGSLTRR
jgi:glycosyltransferase involved in cell wall biosynthesis